MKKMTTVLSNDEMGQISGGVLPAVAVWAAKMLAGAIASGMAYDIVCHAGDTIDSFNAGRAEADEMWRH